MNEKLCPKCKTIKPLSGYYKNRAKSDGVQVYCKECWIAMQRKLHVIVPDGMKLCTKCNTIKPVSDFSKCKTKSDGLASNCKTCVGEGHKQWREKYKEQVAAKKRDEYERHKTQYQKSSIVYQKNNKEKIRKYLKEYFARFPEKRQEIDQKRRAQKMGSKEHHTAQDVKNIMTSQENKCFWCNQTLTRYHVDHVIPLSKGGDNSKNNIVIACPTCNLRKKDKMPDEWLNILAAG